MLEEEYYGKLTTSFTEANKLIIIDVSNIAFRMHAVKVKNELTTSTGYPTGHIYRAITHLISQVNRAPDNTALIFALDGFPKWKYDLYPEYKHGGRPRNFDPRADIIRLFSMFPSLTIANPEEECDDVMMKFVDRLHKTNPTLPKLILSSDHDLWQMLTKSAIEGTKGIVDNKYLKKKYDLEMQQAPKVAIYKALRGDASDNLLGAKGLIWKYVKDLVLKSDTLEDFYNNLGEITNEKTLEKLKKHKETAFLNYKICNHRADYTMVKNIDRLHILIEEMKKYECVSLIPKLEKIREQIYWDIPF